MATENLEPLSLKYFLPGPLRKICPTPGLNKKFRTTSHLHFIKFCVFFQKDKKFLEELKDDIVSRVNR